MTRYMTEHGAPPKALLVASTGGHLAQLHRFSRTWNLSPDSLWVTFRSEQSTSLLRDARVLFVPYVRPRDLIGAARAFWAVGQVLRRERFDYAVSTGAAVAVSAFLACALFGIKREYIESVSRVNGPSFSGRIIARLRLATTYTQHASWAGKRWRAHPPVLAEFRSLPSTPQSQGALRVFVTLGTIKPYRFDTLVNSLRETGVLSGDSVWQVGETSVPRDSVPGTVQSYMTNAEFTRAVTEADVVVTHSGVGTVLQLLEMGIYPVVVPRRRRRNEHVDDHQEQIAGLLESLGLAEVVEAPELTERNLRVAAAMRVRPIAERNPDRA